MASNTQVSPPSGHHHREVCVGVFSDLNRKHQGAGRSWQGVDMINKHALRTQILPFGEDV